MEKIIGYIIKEIYDDDGLVFILEKDNKKYKAVYELYGDCCAYPYIESFDNKDWLINQEVISAEHFYLDSVGDDDVIDYHRYEISSRKGTASIEFRVSHNGYYGGSINFISLKEI